jgi:hypothetical protein
MSKKLWAAVWEVYKQNYSSYSFSSLQTDDESVFHSLSIILIRVGTHYHQLAPEIEGRAR